MGEEDVGRDVCEDKKEQCKRKDTKIEEEKGFVRNNKKRKKEREEKSTDCKGRSRKRGGRF